LLNKVCRPMRVATNALTSDPVSSQLLPLSTAVAYHGNVMFAVCSRELL